MPHRAPVLLRAILTLASALLAGWLLDRAGLPLGWLVGAMLVMMAAAMMRLPAVQPTLALPYVKGAVGTMLGAAIPAGVVQSLGQWWLSLLVMSGVMVLGGLVNYRMLRRLFGYRRMDAALCAMPGGISEMILLGEQAGADQRRVAIVHALRIALSILIIPVLAGWAFGIEVANGGDRGAGPMSLADWLWFAACVLGGIAAARWTRLPAPLILVPLVLSAGLHLGGVSGFDVPASVSVAIQVMIGISVGGRFLGIPGRTLAGVALSATCVVAVQIGLALGAAIALAARGAGDALALTLAYSPGGLAEMSLIAVTMGREVAFVACHHILRVLSSLLIAPPLLSRLAKDPA